MTKVSEPDRAAAADQPRDPSPPWPERARYLGLAGLIGGLSVAIVLFVPIVPTLLVGLISAVLLDLAAYAVAGRIGGRYPLITGLVYLLLVVIVGVGVLQGLEWARTQLGVVQQTIDTGNGMMDLPPTGAAAPFGGVLVSSEALVAAFRGIARLVLGVLVALVGNLVELTSVLGMGLLLGFFVQLDLYQANGVLARVGSARFGRDIALILAKLDLIWGRFLLANVLYGIVVGLASYVQFLLMGVPFALILALLTGIISLIPSFGGLISNIVVFIPTLVLGSSSPVFADMPNWQFASLVFVVNIPITQAAYYFFLLPAMSRAVQLPLALVSVGVLLAFAYNSTMLAFLIVPLLGTVRALGAYVLAKALQRDPFPGQAAAEQPGRPGFFSQLYWSRWRPPPVA